MFQWHAKVFSKASPNVSSAQRSPWARLHARDLPTAAAPPVCLPASASDWHCLALLHMFIEAIWLIDSPYAVTNIYIYYNITVIVTIIIVIIMFQYIAIVYCNYCNALYYIHIYVCILLLTLYTLCYHSISYHYTMHNMYNYIYNIYWIILVHYRNYK